jgi:CRISPR-associated protein Cas5h
MKTAILCIEGRWAHFKKPETNNNPLTHDFITKTAMIGMMGAIMGIDREHMRFLFPALSEDLVYGVALEHPVWKQSWAFTLRRFDANRARLEPSQPAPKAFEFLREPKFTVVLTLKGEQSYDHFTRFLGLVREGESYYEPVLGLHNCPALVTLIGTGQAAINRGHFTTRGFIPRMKRPNVVDEQFRVGFERLPTYQNEDMWNPSDRYVEVIYTDVPRSGSKPILSGEGEYFHVSLTNGMEEAWCLI